VISLTGIWSWLKENLRLATVGGQWAREVSPGAQKNLRWFFLDGVLGSGLDGIAGPFLSLYMLALGATGGQIGQMTSLSGFFSTLVLLPGAMTSERTGKRKLLFVLCGAGAARFSILLFALLPFVLARPTAIFFIILIKSHGGWAGQFQRAGLDLAGGGYRPPGVARAVFRLAQLLHDDQQHGRHLPGR